MKGIPERQMNGQEVKQLFKGEIMGNSSQGSENRDKTCSRRKWILKESGAFDVIRRL